MVIGKRDAIIVSSSDDEDKDQLCRSSYSSSRAHSRSSKRRTSTRGAKNARSSVSRVSFEGSSYVDEIRLSFDDFEEGFNGFKVSPGWTSKKELWVDKYKPCSLGDLAVHKKKVEEVKLWFEQRLHETKDELYNHVIVITGQTGVGKSATVQLIASHLGAKLYEWNTPTPTIWKEHLHNCSSGIQYTSKLDEFENFVERIRKYGSLGAPNTSIMCLIDDLPVTNGKYAFARLHNCLHVLVRSTCSPTAILFTDYGQTESTENARCYFEELQSSLESAGASKIAFNPITVNSIKKTLSRICIHEQHKITAEQIDLIAKASGGDIRHAITSLQYFCLKPDPMMSSYFSDLPIQLKEKSDKFNPADVVDCLHFGRDETLSLFHALGKFLHNKREDECATASDRVAFLVRKEFMRLPLKMDAPEKVLCQAHGQARPITEFLHENVLDFLSEEAIEDSEVITSYLSDADFLLATTRKYESESVVQSAAASVAVRGVLFGKSHPSSSRWHSIRRPKLWQVERSLYFNRNEIGRQRFCICDGTNSVNMGVMATEFAPWLRWLAPRAPGNSENHKGFMWENGADHDSCDVMSLDEQSSISDDEIEDW